MNHLIGLIVMAIIGLAVLAAAGPVVASLLHRAVPVILIAGFVLILVRTVWRLTDRW